MQGTGKKAGNHHQNPLGVVAGHLSLFPEGLVSEGGSLAFYQLVQVTCVSRCI